MAPFSAASADITVKMVVPTLGNRLAGREGCALRIAFMKIRFIEIRYILAALGNRITSHFRKMLILLSPAKTLDYETAPVTAQMSAPRLHAHAQELATVMRAKSAAQIGKMMDISPKLAQLNVERFAAWQADPKPELYPHAIKQAVLAFDGDVYDGLRARELDEAGLAYAQKHIRILSGLYGVLRPLDLMQAYRLEMGRKLKTKRGSTLYEFWRAIVTPMLEQDAQECDAQTIVNLASEEYSGVVEHKQVSVAVVQPVFEELRPDGNYKVVSFMAKKARGLMARYAIDNRLTDADALKAFDVGGYRFDAAISTQAQWVFRRG
jgi:cytoplasmic iron level regulating protein YaaA (DUF328/UPF0246 family)